jgi:hypothetical protein
MDCRGLLQVNFELEPVNLYIIPRARYAAWLAQKYLSGTRPGALPLLNYVGPSKSLQGLRQGMEYYGNRPYQPGDSLRNIDWNDSSKYNKLISKEFTEFHGQPAVVLVNLAVSNAEEADKLAYNLIIATLTLGQEGIPTAMAVYNQEKVLLTTHSMHANELTLRSLQVIKDITTSVSLRRFLNPPDVLRLRSNIKRLGSSENQSAQALSGLLQIEYRILGESARANPCTKALREVQAKLNEPCSVVIISQRNHDVEALAFNAYSLEQKGRAVIQVA